MSVRRRVWEIVEVAHPGDKQSRAFDITILTLIGLNVLAGIGGTVESVHQRWGHALDMFEVFSVVVFTVEYLARLWSCTVDPRFSRPVVGRLGHAIRVMSLIDLAAIVPFYLPALGIDLRALRVLRLFRVARVAKVARYVSSLELIRDVVHEKKEELILTSVLMLFLLVVSSSVLYYCENPIQPEVFSSIPTTMWWAVATLTTVGYGDMYPITPMGRFFSGVIAILGIGMFALPTGILGAGFVEAIEKRKKAEQQTCPHCGKSLR